MFLLHVYQSKMVIFLLMAGIVIPLGFVIGAMDLWRDRKEGDQEKMEPWISRRSAMPMFLIFSDIVIIGLGIFYTVWLMIEPPNW